jgi:hypothetical protein
MSDRAKYLSIACSVGALNAVAVGMAPPAESHPSAIVNADDSPVWANIDRQAATLQSKAMSLLTSSADNKEVVRREAEAVLEAAMAEAHFMERGSPSPASLRQALTFAKLTVTFELLTMPEQIKDSAMQVAERVDRDQATAAYFAESGIGAEHFIGKALIASIDAGESPEQVRRVWAMLYEVKQPQVAPGMFTIRAYEALRAQGRAIEGARLVTDAFERASDLGDQGALLRMLGDAFIFGEVLEDAHAELRERIAGHLIDAMIDDDQMIINAQNRKT